MVAKKSKNTLWETASKRKKRYKMLFFGPEGCFKTRVALRLGTGETNEPPKVAIVDTEFGSDFYADEFSFKSAQTPDPDEIFDAVRQLVENPGEIKTLIIDSFSVYYEALISKYADLFLKRESKQSAGNKIEYYSIAPKDYQIINREASNLIRFLLKCDLNVIVNCQVKDKWGNNMNVIGTAPDGWKRLPYYFDTVIEIEKKKKGFEATVLKDRTHHFESGIKLPWNSDVEAVGHIFKAIGHKFADGEESKPSTDPKPSTKKTEPEKSESTTKNKPQAPVSNIQDIVKLKKELKIRDRKVWDELLKPYNVNTAKDMTEEQIAKFAAELDGMRPSKAQAA